MTFNLNSYQTFNPDIAGSGGYCFGALMYLDAMTMKSMAEYMADDICRRTTPRSADYIEPDSRRWDDRWFNFNPWWNQVLFLHALTLRHKQSPILGWSEERSASEGSVERKVARALYYAKWWKEKHCEAEQEQHGEHWGTATGFYRFVPTEFLDDKWADCFTRIDALRLKE